MGVVFSRFIESGSCGWGRVLQEVDAIGGWFLASRGHCLIAWLNKPERCCKSQRDGLASKWAFILCINTSFMQVSGRPSAPVISCRSG